MQCQAVTLLWQKKEERRNSTLCRADIDSAHRTLWMAKIALDLNLSTYVVFYGRSLALLPPRHQVEVVQEHLSVVCFRPDTIFEWKDASHTDTLDELALFAIHVLIMRTINTGLLNWCIDASEINFVVTILTFRFSTVIRTYFPAQPDVSSAIKMICTNSTATGHELCALNAESSESIYCWIQAQWQSKLSSIHQLETLEFLLLRKSQLIHGHLKCINSNAKSPHRLPTNSVQHGSINSLRWNMQNFLFEHWWTADAFSPLFSVANMKCRPLSGNGENSTTKLYSYLNVSVNKICFSFGNVLWIIFAMMDLYSEFEASHCRKRTSRYRNHVAAVRPNVSGAWPKLNKMGIEMMRSSEYCNHLLVFGSNSCIGQNICNIRTLESFSAVSQYTIDEGSHTQAHSKHRILILEFP